MSSSTAPSSLNVYKKVTIIRNENDQVTFEDETGNVKSLSVNAFRDALMNAASSSSRAKAKNDIPVPQINDVATYQTDVSANYDISEAYIRYHRVTEKEWMDRVDYVADAEDEQWLKKNSKFGEAASVKYENEGSGGLPPTRLSLQLLESILDLLDTATGLNSIVSLHEAEGLVLEKIPELAVLFPVATTRGQGQGVVKFKHMLQDVYSYWVAKRSKLKRPLLRRYWPVTSTDDSNPHLVFRPREKEKYKLRKKRQNDMDSFQKLSRLRRDFDNLRAVLELVRKREQLNRLHLLLEIERFDQRIYDACDTSGLRREQSQSSKQMLKRELEVPIHFDVHLGGRKARRVRDRADGAISNTHSMFANGGAAATTSGLLNPPGSNNLLTNVAGRNQGEPAPSFLQPLETREVYTSSWDKAVPYITSFENAEIVPTFRYRRRARIGRGGRLCIDRIPQSACSTLRDITPVTVVKAGIPLASNESMQPEHLLDLLPRPIDSSHISRHINASAMEALHDDEAGTDRSEPDEAEGDQVIVRVDDWLETDEQLWGDERMVLNLI